MLNLLLGLVLITASGYGTWPAERAILCTYPAVAVNAPAGFATPPSAVADLAACGVGTVLVKTTVSGAITDAAGIEGELSAPGPDGRSYLDVMRANPQVSWWLDVGEEPDQQGMSLDAYRTSALATIRALRPWLPPGVRVVLELPALADPAPVLQWYSWAQRGPDSGGVLDYYDAVGIHCYGATDPLQTCGAALGELAVNPFVRDIWVTEAGIHNEPDPADRLVRLAVTFGSTPRVRAVFAFALGAGCAAPGWAYYEMGDTTCH